MDSTVAPFPVEPGCSGWRATPCHGSAGRPTILEPSLQRWFEIPGLLSLVVAVAGFFLSSSSVVGPGEPACLWGFGFCLGYQEKADLCLSEGGPGAGAFWLGGAGGGG